jgi:hypothetical protein
MHAVADMYRFHCLSAAQRAAALAVLAGTEGFQYRGVATDRAGRAGMAITFDSGDAATGVMRSILVFDSATGSLLTHEEVMLVNPPDATIEGPAVISYTLYLSCGRTTERP